MFDPSEFELSEATVFRSVSGLEIRAEAGHYFALVTLIGNDYWNGPAREHQGILELLLVLADRSEQNYRYRAHLSYASLLPRPEDSCIAAPTGSFQRSSARICPGDHPIGAVRASLRSGDAFVPHPTEDRFMLQLRTAREGIEVRLTTFQSATAKGPYASGGTSIEYLLPLQRFLWLPATTAEGERRISESKELVDFEYVGKMSQIGIPMRTSPISVAGRAAV